jgi:CRP-like cAMP-binding protein
MDDPRAELAARLYAAVTPLRPDDDVLKALLSAATIETYETGEVLHWAGDPPRAYWFVVHGVFRYHYLREGLERTGQFFSRGMFFGGGSGVLTYDAATRGAVLALPKAALDRALDRDHAVERFLRLGLEEALAGAQRRSAALLQLSAQDRYERLLRDRPEVAGTVPLHMVATYLGVTPEALSRIRRRRVSG